MPLGYGRGIVLEPWWLRSIRDSRWGQWHNRVKMGRQRTWWENITGCGSWFAGGRKLIWIFKKEKDFNRKNTGEFTELKEKSGNQDSERPGSRATVGPTGIFLGHWHHSNLDPPAWGCHSTCVSLPGTGGGDSGWDSLATCPSCWGKGWDPVTHSPPEPQE